jgi:hypothetical protein
MATLKISDLSVGDWVRYKGKECTIASIYMAAEGYPHEVALTYQGISCGWAYIDHLEHITITPEILEANGWERNEEDEYMEYYGDPTSCIAHTKGTYHYRLEVPEASVVCHSVHQLQHALRLAGVDKEINL